MDLSSKFGIANANHSVPLGTLDVDLPYRILHAEKATTRFGPTIILTIARAPSNMVKVFLPRRYASLFSDEDVEGINTQHTVALDLVYKGEVR